MFPALIRNLKPCLEEGEGGRQSEEGGTAPPCGQKRRRDKGLAGLGHTFADRAGPRAVARAIVGAQAEPVDGARRQARDGPRWNRSQGPVAPFRTGCQAWAVPGKSFGPASKSLKDSSKSLTDLAKSVTAEAFAEREKAFAGSFLPFSGSPGGASRGEAQWFANRALPP